MPGTRTRGGAKADETSLRGRRRAARRPRETALAQWLRDHPEISQTQLAEEIGCVPSAISMIASGKRSPRDLLKSLVARTGLTAGQLQGVGK